MFKGHVLGEEAISVVDTITEVPHPLFAYLHPAPHNLPWPSPFGCLCPERRPFFFICLHIWKGSRSIRWGWSLLKNSSGDLQWAEVWNFRKKEWMSQWKGEHSNRLQREWAGLGSSPLSTTVGVQGCSWVDAVKDTRVPDMDIFSDPRGPC